MFGLVALGGIVWESLAQRERIRNITGLEITGKNRPAKVAFVEKR